MSKQGDQEPPDEPQVPSEEPSEEELRKWAEEHGEAPSEESIQRAKDLFRAHKMGEAPSKREDDSAVTGGAAGPSEDADNSQDSERSPN